MSKNSGQCFRKGIQTVVVQTIEKIAEMFQEKDETTYYRRPNGINEYAIIGLDDGHEDIANRIFDEEGYQDILEKIENKLGKKIEKFRFLLFAGYILVDEGGIKKLPFRNGQIELKELIYCSYSLNSENLDFVKNKEKTWKNVTSENNFVIADLYDSTLKEEEKAKIRELVDLVKSEIAIAEKNKAKKPKDKKCTKLGGNYGR